MRTAVFSMYPDDSNQNNGFNGHYVSYTLGGEPINAFRVQQDTIVARIVLPRDTINIATEISQRTDGSCNCDDGALPDCCFEEHILDAVIIIAHTGGIPPDELYNPRDEDIDFDVNAPVTFLAGGSGTLPEDDDEADCLPGYYWNEITSRCELESSCPPGQIPDGNGGCKDNTPCEELKSKVSDVSDINSKLNQLRLNIGSTNFEQGFRTTKGGTGNYIPGTIQQNNTNGSNKVNIKSTSQTTVIAHTHPQSVFYKMFSAQDILKMAQMAKVVQNSALTTVQFTEITMMVIFNNNNNSGDPKAFALRFNNNQAAQNLIDILNDKDEKDRFQKDLFKDYEGDNTGPPLYQSATTLSKQQQHLFNLLDEYNLDISLYEANFNGNNTIEGWQKINKESLQKEPCN